MALCSHRLRGSVVIEGPPGTLRGLRDQVSRTHRSRVEAVSTCSALTTSVTLGTSLHLREAVSPDP